jgi:mannose-1-phosphate guanylyltransferase/mannose-6-phosphate isomerase
MSKIIPVIMCGGSGTRLWPLSRRLEPKQFQKLVGDSSLFQETLQRFDSPAFGPSMVLVNAAHEPRVRMELEQAAPTQGRPQVIIEPAIRSTAPAIAAAAVAIATDDPDSIMLVVPSDHRIGRPDALLDAYMSALPFVRAGGIALFGIRPTAPETGFGYICASDNSELGVHRVQAFIEKPPIEHATQLITDPRHTWNSGIFMFRASTIIEELARHAPAVLNIAAEAVGTARNSDDTIWLSPSYGDAPEISIDHAVMEHSQRLGVLPVSPEWNDLGSFEALWDVSERNSDENVIIGDAVLKDVRRSYVRAGKRLVSIVGLSNIVVIDTDDALLVASRAQSQDVKFIAQKLAQDRHPAADTHVVQQHVAGTSHVLEQDDGYRLERVTIAPGQEMRLAAADLTHGRMVTVLRGEVSILADDGSAAEGPAGSTYAIPHATALALHNRSTAPAEILVTDTALLQGLATADQDNQKRVG